jgi:hypothetical protein
VSSSLFSDLHPRRIGTASTNKAGDASDKTVGVVAGVAVASRSRACASRVDCRDKFVGNPCSGIFASRVGEPRARVIVELT